MDTTKLKNAHDLTMAAAEHFDYSLNGEDDAVLSPEAYKHAMKALGCAIGALQLAIEGIHSN